MATPAEPQEGPKFQVTHVGPYASPTGGYGGVLPLAASDVPMPSFFYALLISLVGWIASFIAYFAVAMVGLALTFAITGGPRGGGPAPILGAILIVPVLAAMYLAYSLVLSLMLPTTYPRALLLGGLSAVGLIVVSIAFFFLIFLVGMIVGVAANIAR
jgi:hypothetical protein